MPIPFATAEYSPKYANVLDKKFSRLKSSDTWAYPTPDNSIEGPFGRTRSLDSYATFSESTIDDVIEASNSPNMEFVRYMINVEKIPVTKDDLKIAEKVGNIKITRFISEKIKKPKTSMDELNLLLDRKDFTKAEAFAKKTHTGAHVLKQNPLVVSRDRKFKYEGNRFRTW